MAFKLGVVITVAAGRERNIKMTLDYLKEDYEVAAVMLVLDGVDVAPPESPRFHCPIYSFTATKHQPGMEQPRNLGVRHLMKDHPDLSHVWFLDSDVLVKPDTCLFYRAAASKAGMDCILIGPYEWMAPGVEEPQPELYNDMRWPMFRERGGERIVKDLSVGMGNFGGNLVWPVNKFTEVGGFHPDLFHGRCEDGELGARATLLGVPMCLVPRARGWHVWHDRNEALIFQRNSIDVPKIDAMHPWIHEKGFVVAEADGLRFDYQCSVCGEQVNSALMWEHAETHRD